MNEQLKKLVEQARQDCMQLGISKATTMGWDELERFAELVRADERQRIKKENQRCYVDEVTK